VALGAVVLVVVVDVGLCVSARLADYVLPASSQYEKTEFTLFNFEFPRRPRGASIPRRPKQQAGLRRRPLTRPALAKEVAPLAHARPKDPPREPQR
jgi:anaerobic selenocysteine-containing dehydrogenase